MDGPSTPTAFRWAISSSTTVPDSVPAVLEVTARTKTGVIMALRHREYPVHGVQFHPESILTEHGKALLSNFLTVRAQAISTGAAA